VSNALANPVLELNDVAGNSLTRNDSWRDAQQDQLIATGLAPAHDSEAAIVQTLQPGAYTATVNGADDGTGVGLLELYDGDASADSRLANISSRGFVGSGSDVMIAGFIVSGSAGQARLIVRGLGPSLSDRGVAEPLFDPLLEVRDVNGTLITANDNWRETQETEIASTSLAPQTDLEATSMISAAPGAYTATLRGNDGAAGIGLLEIYKLD